MSDTHLDAIKKCESNILSYQRHSRFLMLDTGLIGGVVMGLRPGLKSIAFASLLVPAGYIFALNLQERCNASQKILEYHKCRLEQIHDKEFNL